MVYAGETAVNDVGFCLIILRQEPAQHVLDQFRGVPRRDPIITIRTSTL